MIKLAAWLKRHYGCTMNQALKTVIPVKDEVGHRQKKSVCLLVDTKKAQELISIYEKKAKAKYRLMCALIDEPVIDMEIVKDKLNISPATVKALEADGIINVKVESYFALVLKLQGLSRSELYEFPMGRKMSIVADKFHLLND